MNVSPAPVVSLRLSFNIAGSLTILVPLWYITPSLPRVTISLFGYLVTHSSMLEVLNIVSHSFWLAVIILILSIKSKDSLSGLHGVTIIGTFVLYQ